MGSFLTSPDLTPLDSFLCGYVKSDKPKIIDSLEENVRRVVANLRSLTIDKDIEFQPIFHRSICIEGCC